MKIQDLAFLLIFLLTIWQRKSKVTVFAGLICLFLSIPLFQFWVFFTAERLTWYAAAFFLLAIFQILWETKHADRN